MSSNLPDKSFRACITVGFICNVFGLHKAINGFCAELQINVKEAGLTRNTNITLTV